MACYKAIDTSPRFLAVDLEKQLLPGSFEHALNHLIDHEIDLTRFDARYRNDAAGACAYQQQELLAPVSIKGDASRDDERLVEGARTGEYP